MRLFDYNRLQLFRLWPIFNTPLTNAEGPLEALSALRTPNATTPHIPSWLLCLLIVNPQLIVVYVAINHQIDVSMTDNRNRQGNEHDNCHTIAKPGIHLRDGS